jgi:RimJ/RimL family protein N-acetyltransferase
LIESEAAFLEGFGLQLAEGLRNLVTGGDLSPEFLATLEAATGSDPWTYGFAVALPAEGLVIGMAGFKGRPVEGVVEIAYGIAPGYQGRGYATEAARALCEFARASGEVTLLRAHTLPERNASTRVLEKCGFEKMGEVVDPEDGPVWRWERGTG